MKADLIARLEATSQGRDEWRVQNPDTKTFCMVFTWPDVTDPEMEARDWLAGVKFRYPNHEFCNYVVAKVRTYSPQDELIREAIEALKAEKPAPLTNEQRDYAIDAALQERGYPANTKNAGRAGWYAALRAHGIGAKP